MTTCFWKVCHDCGGKGEVPPQKKCARNPPIMSGEIRDTRTSICATCKGTGMRWKDTATHEA